MKPLNSNHESEMINKYGENYPVELIKEMFHFYRTQNFKDANGKPLLLKNFESSLKELHKHKSKR